MSSMPLIRLSLSRRLLRAAHTTAATVENSREGVLLLCMKSRWLKWPLIGVVVLPVAFVLLFALTAPLWQRQAVLMEWGRQECQPSGPHGILSHGGRSFLTAPLTSAHFGGGLSDAASRNTLAKQSRRQPRRQSFSTAGQLCVPKQSLGTSQESPQPIH